MDNLRRMGWTVCHFLGRRTNDRFKCVKFLEFVIMVTELLTAYFPLSKALAPEKESILIAIYSSNLIIVTLNCFIWASIMYEGGRCNFCFQLALGLFYLIKFLAFLVSAPHVPEGKAFLLFLMGLSLLGILCCCYEICLDVREYPGAADDGEQIPLRDYAVPDIQRIAREADAVAVEEFREEPIIPHAAEARPAGPLPDIVPGGRLGHGGNHGVNNQEHGTPRRRH